MNRERELLSPGACPKRDQWFVDGGHCGAAHVCENCTGNPSFVIHVSEEQKAEAKRKADEMFAWLNED